MARRADHVITCSHYMRSHVASVFGVPPTRITVIPNGIDPGDLEPVAGDLDGTAQAIRRTGRSARRCWWGDSSMRRGFISPSTRSHRSCGASGTCASWSPARESRRRSSSASRAVCDSPDTEPFSAGSAMTCSTPSTESPTCASCPSIYEPFGLVALEAMASGCLCVVADTGGLREVVPGDGTVGLRFPSRDSEALGEILERVLGRRRDARTGRGGSPRARAAVRLGRSGKAYPGGLPGSAGTRACGRPCPRRRSRRGRAVNGAGPSFRRAPQALAC